MYIDARKGLLASDEVTSNRLGRISMVPLPETWENIIPVISERWVKTRRLPCGGGCWFKPSNVINRRLPQNNADGQLGKLRCLRVEAPFSRGCRCFDVGGVWICSRLDMVWLWRLLWTVRFFGVCLFVCHPCSDSPPLDANSALYSTSTFWTL